MRGDERVQDGMFSYVSLQQWVPLAAHRLLAGAGDGDVAKAGVEQVRVDAGIGIDQDALGGEALGTVAGDGVPVVEVAVLLGVELNLAVVVETG
jgi:hypothetical protein